MNFIQLVFILSWSGVVVGQCNNNGRLRLVGGTRNGEGRLEVLGSSGYWSSVCPDGWVTRNAGVTCQELCGERKYATSVPAKGRFGPITNPIRIFDTKCAGYENSLVSCPLVESWARNCYEDTAVGICCHSGCDGRNMFLAPRLRYAASCDFGAYTVTVQKPVSGPSFALFPYNKPDCSAKREGANATHNWITVPFKGNCDVSLDLNDDEFVKYSQKLLIKGQSTGPSVSRLYQFLLPVTCGVSRNTNKTIWMGEVQPEGPTDLLPGVNGSVNLDMVIKVFKDPDFTQQLSSQDKLLVGTPLYVELSVDKDKLSAGALSKIIVENCVALPSLNVSEQNIKHVIIKDQKIADDSTDILRSPAFHKVQFRMETFKIPDKKQLYLSCAGYVCPLSGIAGRCNNPAADAQHIQIAIKVADPTAPSSSGSSISVESDGYEVPAPKLKRKPIFYQEDLPGLGPDDEVRIGEEDNKCYTKLSNGFIRLYHKPKQSSFGTKDENPCLNQ